MEWSDPDDYAMQEYDEYIPFCIGDMHCHNWGFTLDGYKPVILDLGCGISDYEELIGDAGISLRCIHYNSSGFLKAA